MIDNTLGNNDMTGLPGPDMAAPGTVPMEIDPSTGVVKGPSPGINVQGKALTAITGNDNAGTYANNTIPKGMLSENYMNTGGAVDKVQENEAMKTALTNINQTIT